MRIRSEMLADWSQFRGATSATGSVITATADTLTFRLDGDSTATVILPVRRIAKLEIARGRHAEKKFGAGVGALTGFIAGATIAALWHASCKDIGCPDGMYRERDGTTGGLLGAIVGAGLGAWLGRNPVDTWVPIAIPAR